MEKIYDVNIFEGYGDHEPIFKKMDRELIEVQGSRYAFPRHIRNRMLIRSKGCSEVSGEYRSSLEASHLFHDKTLQCYEYPEIGMMMTVLEHYIYHLTFLDCPEAIGLTKEHNLGAIKSLYNKLSIEEQNLSEVEILNLKEIVRLNVIHHFEENDLSLFFPNPYCILEKTTSIVILEF